MALEIAHERGPIGVTQTERQPRPGVGIFGQGVRLLVAQHLQPILGLPQEQIRRAQAQRDVRFEITQRGGRRQGLQQRRAAQAGLAPAAD